MPGLERRSQFHVDVPLGEVAESRKAEFEMRIKPLGLKRIAGVPQISQHLIEVGAAEMRQHPSVVQVATPADQPVGVGFLPEPANERPDKKLLGQAHARIRGHFKAPHFDEAQPAGGRVGRVEFVDAELGAVGVTTRVDEEVAEQAVDHPGRHRGAGRRHLAEGHLQLMERVMAGLVDARGLAGGSDEEAAENPTERRVVLPVGQERPQ